jgi:hypothetical protein
MRILRYQTIIALISLTLSHSVYAADLIYGFNNIKVTERFTTSVEFDQFDLKNYQAKDNLKLRVSENGKVIRENAILNKNGIWIWDKILPFSENLKLVILKDDKPISIDYAADTKNSLVFSKDDSSLPMVRGVYNLPPIAKANAKKIVLSFELPKELKNCKDKILAIVYDEKNKILVWQYYGEPKNDLKTEEIDYSDNLKRKIITDEESCAK